jgi:hypothetical protein
MRGSWQTWEIPNLSDLNGCIVSPSSNRYNCIAWAADDVTRWWWPDAIMLARKLCYWPPNVPIEVTFNAFFQAYGTLGYQRCADGSLEHGFQKIAIYGQRNMFGVMEPTHAAYQLPDGRWSSKLGPHEDIQHDTLAAVSGPTYGVAVFFMRRPSKK